MNKVFLSYKLDNKLIKLAERFSYGMNLVLVLALMGLSAGIISQFGYDIWKLIAGHMDHSIIHIMGTLLMLWVMIELMDTEVEHLKKGKFSINIFVEVAMVAVIRDVLIGTLEHDNPQRQIMLVGTIMVLGLVYWLISKAEVRRDT